MNLQTLIHRLEALAGGYNANEAPVHFDGNEATAWASGYSHGLTVAVNHLKLVVEHAETVEK